MDAMSKHFTFHELLHSETAERRGIVNIPNDICIYENLHQLMTQVLEPVRTELGIPIYVNSGYRCPALNSLVGGVPNSYHLHGLAADLTTKRPMHNKELFSILSRMKANGTPLAELLWEGGGAWIHVAMQP